MRRTRRIRELTWPLLGWSVAAGLGIALAITVAQMSMTERTLRAQLAEATARHGGAARSLAICEATSARLQNTLEVLQTSATAKPGGAPLSAEALLARQAQGQDACARAYEAEALVREAAR